MSENFYTLVPEAKEISENWSTYSEFEKGEKLGFIFGKYGSETLIYLGMGKMFKAYAELRRANAVMHIETLPTLQKQQQAIIAAAKLKDPATKAQIYLKIQMNERARFKQQLQQTIKDWKLKAEKGIKPPLTEEVVRELQLKSGFYVPSKPKSVPSDWKYKYGSKGDGNKWKHPTSKTTDVRCMAGNPTDDMISRRGPYIKIQKDGQFYSLDGKVVVGGSDAAHIPAKHMDEINKLIDKLFQPASKL